MAKIEMTIDEALETLGLSLDVATEATIKERFRNLAREAHPDKSTGDEALFKRLNEAQEVLLRVVNDRVPLGLVEAVRWAAIEVARGFVTASSHALGVLSDETLITAVISNAQNSQYRRIEGYKRDRAEKDKRVMLVQRMLELSESSELVNSVWREMVVTEQRELRAIEIDMETAQQRIEGLRFIEMRQSTEDFNGQSLEDVLKQLQPIPKKSHETARLTDESSATPATPEGDDTSWAEEPG